MTKKSGQFVNVFWVSKLISHDDLTVRGMEWTGSIRWIYNPVQSRRIWIGLDQKFTNSADSWLDWIDKCSVCPIFRDLRQFLRIVTLTTEVLPSNLQLYTSSFVLTCRVYKVFGRYILFCPDWTGLDSDSESSAGLDWIRISGLWIWTGLDLFSLINFIPWLWPLLFLLSGAHM